MIKNFTSIVFAGLFAAGCVNTENKYALPPNVTSPTFLLEDAPKIEGKKWDIVENMSDEFSGDSINLEKWQTDPMTNGWGWLGRPPAIFQAKNVSLNDGSMNIQVGPLKEEIVTKRGIFNYYGAIVRSMNPGQVGWYYECRMKANATEMSSTFWLMTKGGKEGFELDIQECIGKVSPDAKKWAHNWDQIFHSNAIHWRWGSESEKVQLQHQFNRTKKNHSGYTVYGAWWKSPREIRFYHDGKYMYSINPKSDWKTPAYLHMAIETYDWNPVPKDGGMIVAGTQEERTTKYDWIRTWKLIEE